VKITVKKDNIKIIVDEQGFSQGSNGSTKIGYNDQNKCAILILEQMVEKVKVLEQS